MSAKIPIQTITANLSAIEDNIKALALLIKYNIYHSENSIVFTNDIKKNAIEYKENSEIVLRNIEHNLKLLHADLASQTTLLCDFI